MTTGKTSQMTTCTLTFYAGAAEAAGGPTRTLEAPGTTTLGEVIAELGVGDERLAAVLAVCTVLVDGRPASAADVLPNGAVKLDVLPPFAGG